uniref:O-methyltransferase domain-containing protein n=1 Tax=Oryza punctata TaxID=4537 RepID=A0A0E0L9V0_ORYPU
MENGTSHSLQDELDTQDLLHGNVLVFHHLMSSLKSLSLRCACGLGIPAALHRLGGSATAAAIVAETGLHPSKLPYLRRLMRALTVSGIFKQQPSPSPAAAGNDDTVYTLTPASRLLVGDTPSSTMSALLSSRPEAGFAMFFRLEEWFRDGGGGGGAGTTTLFEMAHGVASPWDLAREDDDYNRALNEACVVDTSFVMDVVLRGAGGDVFRGLTSLVDVGGGYGAAAAAIARAFPDVKCTVMDLEQVIRGAPVDGGVVQFVAGDMFQPVPPAQAALLKNVLDCWSDDDCVKILRQCKKAIPTRDAGGKVIIINTVVGHGPNDVAVRETQVLYDMYIMSVDGTEREEHEWRKIFLEAGFSDYRIMPILGYQSIIEVFP